MNKNGAIVANKTVGIRLSIIPSTFVETLTPTTNEFGQIDIVIGESGDLSSIDWSTGEYFLKVEVDVKGGENYQLLSQTQLLSVPYALYAGKSANDFSGDFNDLTNKPTTLSGYGITDFDFNGPVQIGSKGVNISEIIEITGTLSNVLNSCWTYISYPEGYTSENSIVLSLEIGTRQYDYTLWVGLGWNIPGQTNQYNIFYQKGPNNMLIVYPGYNNNFFQAAPYKIILMKVE